MVLIFSASCILKIDTQASVLFFKHTLQVFPSILRAERVKNRIIIHYDLITTMYANSFQPAQGPGS